LKAGSSKLLIDDLPAGRVGDEVIYADGSTATITSGAGFGFIDRDKPVAIVGSHLSNGDVIVESPNETLTINELEGEAPIPGLLDPAYVPPIGLGHKGGRHA
jgi:uncharacterized Zn-binding protein involved in type VI secretion